MSKVHDLINYERKKRGIPTAYWSREMARLAQSQADYCGRVGRLVHSSRYAFQGGENLAEGGSNFSPRAIVDCWLHSKAGHREYLLSPRVRKMGVGTAKSKGKTYVAWAFSDQSPSYPDCPYYRPKPIFKMPKIKLFRGNDMFKKLFGLLGLWGAILGAHGLYVHFSRWEAIFSSNTPDMLFLAFKLPIDFLSSQVYWMSNKGFESWFIPAVIGIAGFWVFYNYLLKDR